MGAILHGGDFEMGTILQWDDFFNENIHIYIERAKLLYIIRFYNQINFFITLINGGDFAWGRF
jgi:uncharacterized UPF0146 family protein